MRLATPSEELSTRWRSEAEPPPGSGWELFALTAESVEVGLVALRERGDAATLGRLWIAPEHRRRGHGRDALAAVVARCRDNGAKRLSTMTKPVPEQQRLFADWKVTSRHMELDVTEDPALPEGVTANRMTEAGFAAWQRHAVDAYAVDIASGSGISKAEAQAEAQQQFAELLPRGIDTPDNELWTLNTADGTRAALLWVHLDRKAGHVFIYDVEADSAFRGRGYGRAATRLAETRALAAGLGRVKLHVFDDNVAANRLYTALGYRVTNENRRSWL